MSQLALLQEVDLDQFRVIDCPVTIVDLWNAVSLALAGRADGKVTGADSLKLKSQPEVLTNEFCEQLAEDLQNHVSIHLGESEYTITFECGNQHTPGLGGRSERIVRLMREGAVVLASRQQLDYSTLSDDSEDTTNQRKDELILIDDADKLAEMTFALLARS
ncbi:hypothetical protein [Thalassoglobus sp.]|uniref:hypothetical protein n=1 Tax=Thalassoglobus sp. TaxID=2795869 RepID=UPI003AA80917